MSFNLKMTVELSKRRSHFLTLVFIVKCFSKKTSNGVQKYCCPESDKCLKIQLFTTL